MEKSLVKKRGLAAMFSLCPAAHVIALLGACFTALFFAQRHDAEKMCFYSQRVVQPLHHVLARLTAQLPFSLAEWLYAAAIAGTLVYIFAELLFLVHRPQRRKRLYRLLVRLAALVLGVYALFCLMWGVYYYGDDFIARSGLELREVSADELELTTLYFADLLNVYSGEVPRDEAGLCRTDKQEVLARSAGIFRAAERVFPCLSGPEVPAKGMFFSRALSIMDYTGFFCPFTAEASVSMDFPAALFAATVAHELSHQRGVAKEQEANFVAILASLESGDPDYRYSACLFAYTHLANALAEVDRTALSMIDAGLCSGVRADLSENNRYWAQFETPVQAVTNTLYEGFLQSYEQVLGVRSYGACVDLLVSYCKETARTRFAPMPSVSESDMEK